MSPKRVLDRYARMGVTWIAAELMMRFLWWVAGCGKNGGVARPARRG